MATAVNVWTTTLWRMHAASGEWAIRVDRRDSPAVESPLGFNSWPDGQMIRDAAARGRRVIEEGTPLMFGSDSGALADALFDAEPTAAEWCDLDQGSIISLHSAAASRNVYLPCHYEPYYRYPLVLWLESRPGELRNWFPAVSERNYLAVGVQGPLATRAALGGSSWPRDRSAIAAASEAIHAAARQVAGEFSIHPERVFLAGLHDTAALALTVGLTHPQEFAGVAAIDPGAVPLMVLLREFRRMKSRRAFVGVSERKNSYRSIEELADLLATAGTELTVYNACTAENPEPLVRRLDAWMIQTICEAQRRAA